MVEDGVSSEDVMVEDGVLSEDVGGEGDVGGVVSVDVELGEV